MKMENLDEICNYLMESSIATKDEIQLLTNINGYSGETLNSIIYARTGYHYIEQLQEEASA